MNAPTRRARSLRVAVFVDRFPLVSETFVLRHVTGLLDLGHEVTVFSKRRPEDAGPTHPAHARYRLRDRTVYVDEALPPASAYWEMPVTPLRGRTWLPGAATGDPNLRRALRSAPTFLARAAQHPLLAASTLSRAGYEHEASSLSALHRLDLLAPHRGRFDVLHAHFGPTAKSFRFVPKLLRAPLVVTFHGYDFSSYPRERGRETYERLFREAAAVTVNSRYAGARLRELGCEPSRLHVVHCGIDLAAFPYRPRALRAGERPALLTVARLVEKKGLAVAVRAVARLVTSGVDLSYDIVGDGPLRPQLQALVDETGMHERIRLLGAQDAPAVAAALKRSHVFVLPSVTAADGDQEGTPVSLMEAQASGLPVVSTRHSGIPEIVVDGSSGYLAAAGDEEDLARALGRLLAEPARWPDMGRAGHEHMRQTQDGREVLDQVVRLYESLLGSRALDRLPVS